MFVPIRAETSLVIYHQENVGKKREKRKNGKAQERAAGSLDQILSELHRLFRKCFQFEMLKIKRTSRKFWSRVRFELIR